MKIKKFVFPMLTVLLVASAGSAFFFYQKATALKANPNAVAQKEADSLLAQVGRLIILPTGETPTIATVSDPEKLKDQAFFAKAKVGDKVLLYQNAKKAYLYDPVNNKILEVAPINLGDTGAPAAKAPTKAATTTTTTTKKK